MNEEIMSTPEVDLNNIKQVIVVRKDLNMRKGKIAAQVAHAAMMFLINNNESDRGDMLQLRLSNIESVWLNGQMTKIVAYVESEDELKQLILKAKFSDIECYPVTDAGKTEFNGVATLTCAAFGPDEAYLVDRITGNLKLM